MHTDAVVPFKRQEDKAIWLIRIGGLRGRLICVAMSFSICNRVALDFSVSHPALHLYTPHFLCKDLTDCQLLWIQPNQRAPVFWLILFKGPRQRSFFPFLSFTHGILLGWKTSWGDFFWRERIVLFCLLCCDKLLSKSAAPHCCALSPFYNLLFCNFLICVTKSCPQSIKLIHFISFLLFFPNFPIVITPPPPPNPPHFVSSSTMFFHCLTLLHSFLPLTHLSPPRCPSRPSQRCPLVFPCPLPVSCVSRTLTVTQIFWRWAVPWVWAAASALRSEVR